MQCRMEINTMQNGIYGHRYLADRLEINDIFWNIDQQTFNW